MTKGTGLAATASLALALFAGGTPAMAAPIDELLAVPAGDEQASRFSIAVLPDTQFYSRYSTPASGNQFRTMYGSEPYRAQTEWIAQQAATYDIQFTTHLGDIVDQVSHDDQWVVANDAMSVLEENGMPYSILAGNHDVGAGTSAASPVSYDTYVQHFSAERAAQQSTFGGRDPETHAHEYHVFEVDGQKFLVLALSWEAQQPAIDWAQSVIDAHPGMPTILTSHQLINISNDAISPLPTEFGEYVWKELIAPNDQIFLTYNGHHHGATYWERENNAGHPVYQILMDYQMAYMGGNGYMALTEFDLTNGKIHQTSFSPWVLDKDPELRVADDQALLTGNGQSFTLDFDFAERFPDLKTDGPTSTSPTQALRTYIKDNYTAPEPKQFVSPTDAADYPKVDSTVAHWRMAGTGSEDGEVLPVGTTIPDVAGDNTMTRQKGTGVATDENVTYSTDSAPLSSDVGSVCFSGSGRRTGITSLVDTTNFFTTADDAPANSETFTDGFTFETFIKIPSEFTAEDHRWMAWLSRDGVHHKIADDPNMPDGGEPPFSWGFSNLAEVQFAALDATMSDTGSNWSGEIVQRDQWIHLAVVNDPETQTRTMYVDGVPVLRNAVNTVGIATANEPWVLGAGSYNGWRKSGFIGCIGETRLAAEPLEQDQWLTARADSSQPGVTDEPSDEPTDEPSDAPTDQPSDKVTDEPTDRETGDPKEEPTDKNTGQPTGGETDKPTEDPKGTTNNDPKSTTTGQPTGTNSQSAGNESATGMPMTGASIIWLILAVGALLGTGVLALRIRSTR